MIRIRQFVRTLSRPTPRRRSRRVRLLVGVLVVLPLVSGAAVRSLTSEKSPAGNRADADVSDSNSLSSAIDSLLTRAEFLEATRLAELQLSNRRTALGSEHLLVAESVARLAEALSSQGHYDRAVRLHEEALERRRRILGEHHPDVAASLNDLARAEKNRGFYDRSVDHYEEALLLRRKVYGREHPAVAQSLNGLANVHRVRRKWGAAIPIFREALRIRVNALGQDHPDVADTRTDLALALLSSGEVAEAERELRLALPIRRRSLGPKHPDLGLTVDLLGSAQFRLGHFEEAEAAFREAASIDEVARTRTEPGQNRRIAFRLPMYSRLAAALLEMGREEDALLAYERGHSPDLSEALAKEFGLATAEAGDSGPPAIPEARALPSRRIQEFMPEKSACIGWLEVSAANGAPYASWAYVLRKEGPVRWIRLRPAAQELIPGGEGLTALDAYKLQILGGAMWPVRISPCAVIDQKARDAWLERMSPLMPYLEDVDHLIVVYSWSMADFAIEALCDDSGEYVGDRFTVSYAPSASILARLQKRQLESTRPRERRALLVAGPTTSEDSPIQAVGNRIRPTSGDGVSSGPHRSRDARPVYARTNIHSSASLPGPGPFHGLRPLRWIPWEIERLATILPKATSIVGSKASEREIRRMAAVGDLSAFDTIHLATHSVSDLSIADLSAIVLHEAFEPGDRDNPARDTAPHTDADGLLTSTEILELPFDADLVTLSGCISRGAHFHGDGFATIDAFLGAGANSVVASLWQVEDRATALFMARFYTTLLAEEKARENRIGSSGPVGDDPPRDRGTLMKAEALREARKWLRAYVDADGEQPYQHPVYWSAYVLVGCPD